MVASRKLRPYFHVRSIEVITNYPLCQVIQKPEALGRLLKWAIELGQFDVNYRPRTTIKGHALADFIAEFTYVDTNEVAGTTRGAATTKVVETGNGENFAPGKEYTNDGPSTWMAPPMRMDLGPT